MMQAAIELASVSIKTPTGRTLFADLSATIGSEHIALVGRNGVGKSTLLGLLAGLVHASSGFVNVRGKTRHVPQVDESAAPLSAGEQRKVMLQEARVSGAEILLLDEPTLHLDEPTVEWLRGWLASFQGCVIVASHDRRLLADFRHFFVVSESGCHYFAGSLAELELHLEREHSAHEQRYLRHLHRLAQQEARTDHVARRKARKKRSGRCRELDRATSRMRLNQKRNEAQVSHGRLAKLRDERLDALRSWTQAARRALNVDLALDLVVPPVPPHQGRAASALRGVGARVGDRILFEGVELELGRQRVAVVGPNGAGKTTLLEIMVGQRMPEHGLARADLSRLGWIEQGGKNWLLSESLRQLLSGLGLPADDAARLLVTQQFPLALAERPLRSLSPGERARAALITLFARSPAVEVLVLDEPTFSLDLVGLRALTRALKLWRGGLVVASHDRAFLEELAMDQTIALGDRETRARRAPLGRDHHGSR
jgi:ATPase subunit of ABC transporter with duplicated ATPase domains